MFVICFWWKFNCLFLELPGHFADHSPEWLTLHGLKRWHKIALHCKLIIKNWLYTQHVHDVVDLAAACRSNEVGNNLLKDPTNVAYAPPKYLGKHIKTIYEYIRLPYLNHRVRTILYSLVATPQSFVMSIQQYSVDITLELNNILKYFIEITPLSKLVESTLSPQ